MHAPLRSLYALLLAATLAAPSSAQDWGNYGGNAARNGRTAALGPVDLHAAWSNTDDFSIISWHPFIEDGRVFTVREAGFPQNGGSANDAVIAYDLASGAELWRVTLPFGGDTSTEWIAWIGGVRDGQVYCSRSSNLQPGPLIALDAATGATNWTSTLTTEAWAHDGLVFAPNGDPIIGDRLRIARLDAVTGGVVWNTVRSCPVSGNCGAAATNTALFVDEPAPGGNQVTKLDLASGAILYSSPVMPGFTDQNTPFLSPDGGTVYLSRTQNNPTTDFLYAFEDTGAALVERWNVPVRWTTSHEHGLAADGSIYTFTQANELVRLDPATGAITANAGVLSPLASGGGTGNVSPKTAVDGDGRVYVSNGWASTPASDGRLWAFDADLTQNLFTLNLDRQNAGGPAVAADGTLVVCDRQGVFAYRSTHASCTFRNGSGLNAAGFDCVTEPELGSVWSSTIATNATTAGTVVAIGLGGPDAGTPFSGGELLIQLVPPPLLDLALGAHAVPIPNDTDSSDWGSRRRDCASTWSAWCRCSHR